MLVKLLWVGISLGGLVGLFLAMPRGEVADNGPNAATTERARVLATFPHDSNDFCQGLVVEDGIVYEGTGHYGSSVLKKYELATGRLLAAARLPDNCFGEGISTVGDEIYQLTWKERACFVYDKETLKPIRTLTYTGQGWGLASDGDKLYMSDGSSVIQVLDSKTLKPIRKFNVHYGRRRQDNLNELEMVRGELWACIWYEDRIVRIDPETGRIRGWLDCSSLYPASQRHREHVLNGIAYDAQANRLFITGKNWPTLFEIEVPQFDGDRPR